MAQRTRRDRSLTDSLVFQAVRSLLVRDGVLAGFTFQAIADEAGVNRVQLYQKFGTRRGLLRAAIQDLMNETKADRSRYRNLPFVKRRRAIFEQALANPDVTRLEALLAQDGDDAYQIFPEIDLSRANLLRDYEEGALPEDADGVALHVLTAAAYMGYCVFRDGYARDVEIDAEELDGRVLEAFEYLLDRALTKPSR
ncbi:TetR/AcrR family transcriptional regulator [Prescottella sp. R16]|uniref:TetR/AcrR family transcriptional regulator n=1 Tax=Prescottella sp. R16 TaxID=3064529 RepID=UPI00272DD56E|nr:TetR family transcriptional regulator [Prescottella sp. R16]